ncbi:tudor domain-containing protein 1 isoform X1 [Clarias magur]|uniref:Tudor domain-containing protein 1 n=1 Tax=Clarias magur TaxID=1594786 RepID=A0A8J4WY86_CLAMG|nr:tudor domain-containing protein 1 isoform X1 [Clarias magur]
MPAPVTVNLCNYCSNEGNLRCTRCKKTCYCSVTCQTEDWKAHRHICKPNASENNASDKPKVPPIPGCGDGPSVLESKLNSSPVEPKRAHRKDLRKHNFFKGDELHASVVEMRSPGKFFIHIQSLEMSEILKNITINLQKVYGGSLASAYKPEIGELCAVKFSLDQNWYRGEIESVDLDHLTAKVLYIDFGNEEDVKLEQIRPLSANIDNAPPCALQCCIAGVSPVTSSWSGECCIALRQLVAGKSLTFTVVDFLCCNTVLAVDAPLSTHGKNLSTFLIDDGYAIKENTSTKAQLKQDIGFLMTASLENFKRLSIGKNENAEAQPPEPLSQGVGDTFTAIVTHLQSPSEIICQKLENASSIQQLQMNLREHCNKTQASENFRPAPGTVCCSRFLEDNQWYRAKVLAYSPEDRVFVGYIDFGNSEEVSLNQLRPISMALLSLAAQAIPCALAGIKPISDAWSEESVIILKKLVCNRFIHVEIVGEQHGTALVSMVDESSDPQTNVAELLVATGHAAAGNMETVKEETVESLDKNMCTSSRLCQDKLVSSCAELPTDGLKVVLVVSVLENPGQFYCYNYKLEDMQTLVELSASLTKHCEADRTAYNPVVGEPCCARFKDGSWYRAIVQSLDENGNAKVYFVDYGNTFEIQTAHLRAINPGLLKLPFQAICCWLAGCEPLGAEWSKDAVQKFQTLCFGKQLTGRVLSVSEKGYGVELESNGHNVAAVLIAEQFAKPAGQENKPSQGATFSKPKEAAPVPAEIYSHTKQPDKTPGQTPAASPSRTPTASFCLDWKTVELPRSETFQPQVAAVTSPSLFYVMNPREVNVEKLQSVMTEVMRYCSKQTQNNQSMPLPGAACCAQFSGDKNWYRAIVLEVTSTYASVIYADYGNMELVSVSSLLPIPKALLQHPFQIARCALSEKEHFPTVWPPELLELFGGQMNGKVLASVEHFDGTFNLLNITEGSAEGGSNINDNILRALKNSPSKSNTKSPTQEMRAQGHGPKQTGSASSDSDHSSSADAGKPKPQSLGKEFHSSQCLDMASSTVALTCGLVRRRCLSVIQPTIHRTCSRINVCFQPSVKRKELLYVLIY